MPAGGPEGPARRSGGGGNWQAAGLCRALSTACPPTRHKPTPVDATIKTRTARQSRRRPDGQVPVATAALVIIISITSTKDRQIG